MCESCEKNIRAVRQLGLFKFLILDGCKWGGIRKTGVWEEVIIVPRGLDHQVRLTLENYDEGKDYEYTPAQDTGPAGGEGEIRIRYNNKPML